MAQGPKSGAISAYRNLHNLFNTTHNSLRHSYSVCFLTVPYSKSQLGFLKLRPSKPRIFGIDCSRSANVERMKAFQFETVPEFAEN
nr:hypothetical protein Iba_chr10fCG2690 [Ipomoea batatas]